MVWSPRVHTSIKSNLVMQKDSRNSRSAACCRPAQQRITICSQCKWVPKQALVPKKAGDGSRSFLLNSKKVPKPTLNPEVAVAEAQLLTYAYTNADKPSQHLKRVESRKTALSKDRMGAE